MDVAVGELESKDTAETTNQSILFYKLPYGWPYMGIFFPLDGDGGVTSRVRRGFLSLCVVLQMPT